VAVYRLAEEIHRKLGTHCHATMCGRLPGLMIIRLCQTQGCRLVFCLTLLSSGSGRLVVRAVKSRVYFLFLISAPPPVFFFLSWAYRTERVLACKSDDWFPESVQACVVSTVTYTSWNDSQRLKSPFVRGVEMGPIDAKRTVIMPNRTGVIVSR
jgi:hypothetical protein